MKRNRKILIICVCFGIFLTACAGQNPETAQSFAESIPDLAERASNPAGFWRGYWHGLCASWAFLSIIFGADIGVYEVFNTGNWYNFGFLLGIGSLSLVASFVASIGRSFRALARRRDLDNKSAEASKGL